MSKIEPITEVITVYPFNEGVDAAKLGKSAHENPYKSPNTAKTDDVKSEAWLRGYASFMDNNYHPI